MLPITLMTLLRSRLKPRLMRNYAELATKGLTKTDSDDADLYIDYQRASGLRSNLTATRRVGAPAAGAAAGMVPAVP